jgi:hypothetical protein
VVGTPPACALERCLRVIARTRPRFGVASGDHRSSGHGSGLHPKHYQGKAHPPGNLPRPNTHRNQMVMCRVKLTGCTTEVL